MSWTFSFCLARACVCLCHTMANSVSHSRLRPCWCLSVFVMQTKKIDCEIRIPQRISIKRNVGTVAQHKIWALHVRGSQTQRAWIIVIARMCVCVCSARCILVLLHFNHLASKRGFLVHTTAHPFAFACEQIVCVCCKWRKGLLRFGHLCVWKSKVQFAVDLHVTVWNCVLWHYHQTVIKTNEPLHTHHREHTREMFCGKAQISAMSHIGTNVCRTAAFIIVVCWLF